MTTTNTTNQSITNDLYFSNYKTPVKETGNSELGKDAFLQLLITQLQNQDPTKPMDDSQFIAQMAQFSSLEQMQNMTKALESLLSSQEESQLMNYTTFIGKEVKWHEITDEKDVKGNNIVAEGNGVIDSLTFLDGEAVFKLVDGKEISPGNISSVLKGSSSSGNASSSTESLIVQASMLIGKSVSYMNGEEKITGRVVSVSNKDGVISYNLDNDAKVKANQFEVISE